MNLKQNKRTPAWRRDQDDIRLVPIDDDSSIGSERAFLDDLIAHLEALRQMRE